MKTLAAFLVLWIILDFSSPPLSVPVVRSLTGTTENAEARKDFEKGLLLLHNFEYPDAAELFQSAQQKDPSFALAYWGEAMTFNHPIWLSQDTERGREILTKYKRNTANIRRPLPDLDAALIQSVDILYGDGDKRERDRLYAEYMSTLYDKHRDNLDIASFYALALLGQAGGWNEQLCNRAADVAGGVLKVNAKHPGALHYFIHAEDHPEFANLAWNEANSYAKVASYSGHALHMPSHIYLALGVWDEVVRSNEISWKASFDRKENKRLTNDALSYHAHWWLSYGYLQQGRFARAKEVLDEQFRLTEALPSSSARNHFVIMRGHYFVETNDWKNTNLMQEVKLEDLRIEIRNLDRFIRGLKACTAGDRTSLSNIISTIAKDLDNAMAIKRMDEGVTQCGSSRRFPAAGLNQTSILLEELKALEAYLNKNPGLADAHFRKAVQLEEENGYFYGPPEIIKPTFELYGEFLLETGRYAEAIVQFERSLQRAPGRNQSLSGLAQALAKTGDIQKKMQVTETLKKNLKASDRSSVTSFFANIP